MSDPRGWELRKNEEGERGRERRHAEGEEIDKEVRSSRPRGRRKTGQDFLETREALQESSQWRDSGARSLSSQFVLTADLARAILVE